MPAAPSIPHCLVGWFIDRLLLTPACSVCKQPPALLYAKEQHFYRPVSLVLPPSFPSLPHLAAFRPSLLYQVCAGEVITGILSCKPNAKNPRDLDITLEYHFEGQHCEAHRTQVGCCCCCCGSCAWLRHLLVGMHSYMHVELCSASTSNIGCTAMMSRARTLLVVWQLVWWWEQALAAADAGLCSNDWWVGLQHPSWCYTSAIIGLISMGTTGALAYHGKPLLLCNQAFVL